MLKVVLCANWIPQAYAVWHCRFHTTVSYLLKSPLLRTLLWYGTYVRKKPVILGPEIAAWGKGASNLF